MRVLIDTVSSTAATASTTRPTATNGTQTSITVASAAGFPASGNYYIRIDNEVMLVTAGQGTTIWTVSRGQLNTAATTHSIGATVVGPLPPPFSTWGNFMSLVYDAP